jgi:NTE family protein
MEPTHKKVGLALGGGGARGYAHIGVLKVLLREGIPIDYIAGVSMGAIVAAAFGAGLPIEELEQLVLHMRRKRDIARMADIVMPQRGLVEGRKVRAALMDQMGLEKTFNQLNLPVAMVATDLAYRRAVVLDSGSVLDSAMASSAFPGIFPPVEIDGKLLCDGGMINNVPTDVARNMGAEIVIAVDVIPAVGLESPAALPPSTGFASLARRIEQSFWIMAAALTEARLKDSPPDLLLRPPIPEDLMIFLGFTRPDEAIAAGEQAAEEALPEIKRLVWGEP